MSIRPVFFFVIKIFVSEKQKMRIYLPLPIFCLNDFVESLADLTAFLNIVTFGKLKITFSKSKAFPHKITMKKLQSALYTFSDFFTELSLFTGRTDFVDIKTDSEDEKVRVKIFTC